VQLYKNELKRVDLKACPENRLKDWGKFKKGEV